MNQPRIGMHALHKILDYLTYKGDYEKYSRQNRLIRYITWELIAVCTIIVSLYAISKLWYLVLVIAISVGLALVNLWILKQTRNSLL
jgi:membrane protein YdbS with pleckstrin-like domain